MSLQKNQYTITQASLADLSLILRFRSLLFQEMGIPADALRPEASRLLEERYRQEYAQDRLIHYAAYDAEGSAVALVGMLLKDDFPYHFFQPGYYGWVVDVYTLPAHRGQGISRELLDLSLNWLRGKGAREARLIASGSEARRLYARAGFRDTWEMYSPLGEESTYNDYLYHRERTHAATP